MTCNHCGAENVKWASFCTQCGEPAGELCYCSSVIRPGDVYCSGCGRLVEKKRVPESVEGHEVIPMVHQYKKAEIDKLIKESILVKAGKESELDQSDIDEYFNEE